jgi:hypothetical protein
MTIETIADLVWALDHCIKVEIFDPKENNTNKFMIVPKQDQSFGSPNFVGTSTDNTVSYTEILQAA